MASPRSSSVTVSRSLFAIYIILAEPLQALSSSTLPQLLSSSNSTSFPTLNVSSSSSSSSPSAGNAGFEIHCSGEHFGANPNIADCESAKEYISPDSVQYTWGDRHSGIEEAVFPLPYRIMGDRALCFFQAIIANNDIRIAHASLGQIRSAASALILQCAAGGESQGGAASNIGGDNNLVVVLGTYEPNVQCRGTFGPEWSSCRDLLGDMPAGKKEKIWGPRSAPGVEQGLPILIESSDEKCAAQIFSTGIPDLGCWYRMWEAVTAIFSVCVRAGRGGVFTGLGDLGHIFLTVSSMAPGVRLAGDRSVAVTS